MNPTIKYIHRITIFLWLILLLGTVLRLDFYLSNSIDSFLSTPISLAYVGISNGYIKARPFGGSSYWASHANEFSEHRILTSILLVILSKVLGVRIEEIAYLPIIGILVPLLGAVIIRLLTRSRLGVLLYTTFLVFTPFLDQFRFNYQPLAYFYHFLLLYFIVKLFFTSARSITGSRAVILITTILIIDSYQSYYTVEMSNFLLFLGIFIFIALRNWWFHKPYPRMIIKYSMLNLLLITSLVFFGMDNVVYVKLKVDYVQKLFIGLSKFFNRLVTPHNLQQSYTPTTPISALYLDLLIRTFLIAVIICPTIIDGLTKKGLLKKIDLMSPLIFSLLFYSIIEPIVYQGITTDYAVSRNMILFLPIASFAMLEGIRIFNSRIRSILKIIIVLVLVFVMLRYVIILNSDYQTNLSRNLRNQTMIAMERIMPYLTPRCIISTHEISSLAFVQAVMHQKVPDVSPNPFKDKVSKFYEGLINNNEKLICSEFSCDLIISRSFEDRPIRGEIWGGTSSHSPPLSSKLYIINNFKSFNKIYDNGMIMYYARLRSIVF